MKQMFIGHLVKSFYQSYESLKQSFYSISLISYNNSFDPYRTPLLELHGYSYRFLWGGLTLQVIILDFFE